jgi:hypothetical protein
MDQRKQIVRGLLDEFLTAIRQPDKTSIVPAPNRWFAKPEEFPHQQPMIERALAATGKSREDFPFGAYIDPRSGQDLTGRMMQDVGVLIDPNTGRPLMSGRPSDVETFDELNKKLGSITKSNLVRRNLYEVSGGDPMLDTAQFLATIERGPHFYGLGTEYASPTQLFQVERGDNPHLRPKSRGDVFGMGEVVGRMQMKGSGKEHDVYEKLFVAPRGSDVPGKKLSKAAGGEAHAAGGGLKQAVRSKIDDFLAELKKPAKAAPQDEALRLAQQRAALPPAQGGLGLPANNTPEQRAKAMEWNTLGFHATNADIKKFDPNLYGASDYGNIGQGVYIDPSKNAGYANLVASIVGKDKPANVMPLLVREGNVFNADQLPIITNAKTSKEVSKNLKKLGYDSVMSEVNGQPNEMVVFDPDRVRSRFAAFDPFRRDAATAALFGVAAPDLLAQEQEKAAGGEVYMDKGGDPMLADLIERYNTPRNKSRYSAGIFDSNAPGEVTSITPTVKERMASGLQSAMESAGSDRYKARQRAQTIVGGPNSRLPGGFGVADIGAMVNPTVAAAMIPVYGEAALHDLASVPDALKRGDYVGAGVDTAFGLMDLIPAIGQGKQVAKGVAKGLKDAVTSDAGYDLAQRVLNATGTAPAQIMMGPMSKTWRKADADLAVKMESEGRNPTDIWRKTGTFRAPDGRLRQEIADENMKYTSGAVEKKQYKNARKRYEQAKAKATTPEELNDANDYWNKTKTNAIFNLTGKAQDFVNHPELFAAYPELAKYAFKQLEPTHSQFTAPETTQGFYSPKSQRITINTDAPYKRSTALHELQHAIQELEGWQGGSNPEYIAAKMAERDLAKASQKRIQDKIDELKAADPIGNADLIRDYGISGDWSRYILNQTEPLEGITDPYEAYKKMSGEEEARMVQARRDYDERSRRDSLPIWNYETPPSEQITKDFADGGAVMMAGGKDVTKEAIKQGVKKGVGLVEDFLSSLKPGEPQETATKALRPSKEVAQAAAKAVKDAEQLASAPVVQTVANPERMQFPGIYKRPDVIAAEAAARVAPESPMLKRLFGVTRNDLYEMGKGRQGNLPGTLPGLAANPKGSKVSAQITTPQNTQRMIDVMSEAEKHPALVQGMDPWYVMDPLYQRMVRELGPEKAANEYNLMNHLFGMSSPGSEVMTEIPRGSAAYFLHKQGRFPDFEKYAGMPAHLRGEDFPQDILTVPGHAYHSTAQAGPMRKFLEKGELDMSSPKVPMYIQASGVPEVGFQTATPVGDAHWSRAVGLADVRGGSPANWKKSVSNTEMYDLGPWWREQVAAPMGLESVPAQGRTWGAFSPQTGVTTPIGAPKLELIADQTGMAANRLGISPEDALIMFINAKARLGKKEGGAVESDVDGFLDHMNKAQY